ncbi:hypothetical protein QYE76_038407 [Lolium multiflorum]|uniref:Uncharacterized protein n=1 Tax=Lolium multiflorum TaxID=4521 RepID=A0AAD8T7T3_LOLMU|nr:hypothetical protein QYE76_038407 [Lolium multiflorum]
MRSNKANNNRRVRFEPCWDSETQIDCRFRCCRPCSTFTSSRHRQKSICAALAVSLEIFYRSRTVSSRRALLPKKKDKQTRRFDSLHAKLAGAILEQSHRLVSFSYWISLEIMLVYKISMVCLQGLRKLKYLNLSDNTFTGSIPVSIRKLVSLEVLNLKGNNLSGDIQNAGNENKFNILF